MILVLNISIFVIYFGTTLFKGELDPLFTSLTFIKNPIAGYKAKKANCTH